MKKRRPARGYIALMAVLAVSALIVTAIASFGASNMLARSDQMDADLKTQSRFLAQSCARLALLHVEQDDAYSVAEARCEPVGDECPGESTCLICSVSDVFPKEAVVQGAYRGAYTTLSAAIESDYRISHVRELQNSAACAIH